MAPGDRHAWTSFIDRGLTYSHQGKVGKAQDISSFPDRALQKIIEKHSYIQYMPYTLALSSARELLTIFKTPLGQNSC